MKCSKCGAKMKEGGCFQEIYFSCPSGCDWDADREDTLELFPTYEYLFSGAPQGFVRKMFKAMVQRHSTLRIPRVCPKGPYTTLRVPIKFVIAYDGDVAVVDTRAPFEILDADGPGMGAWSSL